MRDPRHAHTRSRPALWPLLLPAAAILMISMGARQSLGLFVSPLNTATGLGIVAISFAMAVGQFFWGASQSVFGAVADRYGSTPVLMAGGVMLALGLALTPFVSSQWMLLATVGFLMSCGAGAGSFAVLIGATARHLPPEKRPFASGFINAGGSFGQFLFAPLNQAVISGFGWVTALLAMAGSALLTLPLAGMLPGARPQRPAPATDAAAHPPKAELGLRRQLQIAFKDKSYWLVHASFFTCGFHIAFLITHLPGEAQLCGLSAGVAATSIAIIGLANIAGSLGTGVLGGVYRMKWLLFWMYATRALAVAIYLAAPKTSATFYAFAFVLGLTWLATVPSTAGLVGKLFGMRYLATLFGLTLLTHQIGGFFGAWLGGLAVASTGSYAWMWYADIALASVAALANLPIKEAPLAVSVAPA
jgi:MFS family permease